MSRDALLAMLQRYVAVYPEDEGRVHEMRAFVAAHADCFVRSCAPGHVTASAWVLSPDQTRVLLTHHRKLGRWLQPGGHADGETDLLAVAMREVREETGLGRFVHAHPAGTLPLDVDVHWIPARGDEAAHRHFDVRYLLVAAPGQTTRASEESHALRWIATARLEEVTSEESVLRLARKARELASRRRG
jgi:8-oxo-dGTP pyrophosphatase MutT (NUDIX family)